MTENMLSDQLERLADRENVTPPPLANMIANVRRKRHRRRLMITSAVSLTALIVAGGSAALLHREPVSRPSPGPQITVSPPVEPAQVDRVDVDGTWVLRGLVDRTGQVPLIADAYVGRVRLTFEDGRLTGTTGCNDIFGTYQQSGKNGSDLVFPSDELGASQVHCTDEPPILQRLTDVRHVNVSGGALYLHAENWMIIAELRRHWPPR